MITDRDICMAAHFRGDLLVRVTVEEIMSRKVHSVKEDDTLLEAEQVMQEMQLRRLPVVDEEERLVGLISLADIAVAAAAAQGRRGKGLTLQAVAKTIGGICEKRPQRERISDII
jgi:CBS-domain-containing membrane protein